MSYFGRLALDIITNQDKYIVNRDEKMSRTVDKMVDNIDKKIEAHKHDGRTLDDSRGYGQGRKMGD